VPDAQLFFQARDTLVQRAVTAPTGMLGQCAQANQFFLHQLDL